MKLQQLKKNDEAIKQRIFIVLSFLMAILFVLIGMIGILLLPITAKAQEPYYFSGTAVTNQINGDYWSTIEYDEDSVLSTVKTNNQSDKYWQLIIFDRTMDTVDELNVTYTVTVDTNAQCTISLGRYWSATANVLFPLTGFKETKTVSGTYTSTIDASTITLDTWLAGIALGKSDTYNNKCQWDITSVTDQDDVELLDFTAETAGTQIQYIPVNQVVASSSCEYNSTSSSCSFTYSTSTEDSITPQEEAYPFAIMIVVFLSGIVTWKLIARKT